MGLMLSRDASRRFASVKLRGKAAEAIIRRFAMHFTDLQIFCSRDGIIEEVYHLGANYLERSNYRPITTFQVQPRRKRREQ